MFVSRQSHTDAYQRNQVYCCIVALLALLEPETLWFVVHTDSKSIVKALRASISSHPLVRAIQNRLTQVTRVGTFCWASGHVRVVGNERSYAAGKKVPR